MDNKELEQYINRVVKETIDKVVNKTLLTEYALQRKDFCQHIDNLVPQIIIHWCLIRYSRNIGDDNNLNLDHWKVELKSWFYKIMKLSIKTNDDYKIRYKAIQQIWDKNDYDKNILAITFTIAQKFQEEGVKVTNNEYLTKTMQECLDEHKNFIHILANKNLEEINNYVDEL